MVEFISNLCDEVENGDRKGLTYDAIEGIRIPRRREARMAAMEMKRATTIKKILFKRGEARVLDYVDME